jgi:hypothetical protein
MSDQEPKIPSNLYSLRKVRDTLYSAAEIDAKFVGDLQRDDLKQRARARRRALFKDQPPVMPTISSALIDEERRRRLKNRLERDFQRADSSTPEGLSSGALTPLEITPGLLNRQERARVKNLLIGSSKPDIDPDLPPAS